MLTYKTFRYLFGSFFIATVLYGSLVSPLPFWVYPMEIMLWMLFIIYAAFRMRAGIFLTSICSLPNASKKNIILTFDDGPHPVYTPLILEVLKAMHAKAVFFCIGKNIVQFPELAKQIAAEGHIVANHSYNHSNFIGMYAAKKVAEEIAATEQIIQQTIGRTYKLYRPPFGVTNPNIAKAVQRLSMHSIGWNKRSFDTVSKSTEKVLNRIKPNLKNGDIILLHDTNAHTPVILAEFLLFANANGFIFEVNDILDLNN